MSNTGLLLLKFSPIDPVKFKNTTECSCTQTRRQHPSNWWMVFSGLAGDTSKPFVNESTIQVPL